MRLVLALLIATSCSVAKHKSCGAANCPLNTHRYLGSGVLNISLTHEYINQDQIYVGSSRSVVGAIPEKHDEVQTLNERNVLQILSGLSDRLSVSLDVPFIHREHSHIDHDAGGSVWQSWIFSGLGDISVASEYALLLPAGDSDSYLGISAGLKLPSGITHATNAEGEEAEVTIQPGTGSTDAIIRLNYRRSVTTVPAFGGLWSSLPITLGLSYQVSGRGTNDYRFGNVFLAHVGTEYQFAKRADFLFQINGRFQDFADVGSTGEPRENTGGTWIFASPGLGIQLSDALSASAYVQLPAYQNVHGIQQTASVNLALALSFAVDLVGGVQ